MAAPGATISYQNGNAAASNVANGATAYVDPGNTLTLALQSSTGVASWVVTVQSDYQPMNGTYYQAGLQGPFTYAFTLPQQPCKLVITSEVTDGNNVFTSVNTFFNYPRVTVPDRTCRYVCTANVNLASTNTQQDGVTGVAGDRILLVGQTTLSQNGPYMIGTVTTNLAALTRPADYATGQVVVAPVLFDISEGTTWSSSTWKNLSTGACTVDTSSANYYPKFVKGTVANVAASGNVNGTYVATGAIALGNGTVANVAVTSTTISAGAGTGFVVYSGTANGLNANGSINYCIINW